MSFADAGYTSKVKHATFLVVRHGQTQWNKENRMMGISDIPLTVEGVKQAEAVARYLKSYPIDYIISSPLLRAVQTAQAIQAHHSHIPITTMADVHERSFGVLEGLTYEEANARYPQIVLGTMWQYPRFRPPGGESLSDVAARAKRIIEHLADDAYRGRTVAIVSHGSFIRNFLSVILDIPLEEVNRYGFANASVSVVRYSPETGGEAHVLNKVA